jgi:hypothetical protein
MSRLDRHVALVQNKLAMQRFVDAIVYLMPVAVSVAFAARLVQRQTTLTVDMKMWWLGVTVASVVFAIGWAIYRRPKFHDAAVAIDERLGLKEKFSTALAMRNVNDPFAMAAVRDAEHTADNVSLNKRFPLAAPASNDWRLWTLMIVLAAVALILPEDAFKRKAEAKKQAAIAAEKANVKKAIESDIARVEAIAQALPANKEAIEAAKKDLKEMLKHVNATDPTSARRTAAQTLQDLDKAIKNEIGKSKDVVGKMANDKMLAGLQSPSAEDKGPVAEAHKALAKQDLAGAVDKFKEATEKFDKMSKEEKEKAAAQMQKLAQDLAKQAANPAAQQNMANQLQQAGMNQQQAQQMAQQMQQAAAGDKQAQQQLQQAAQQAMQQMNGGQGPTPQQQAALNQAMQQAQAAAQGQMNAQQMANAAQQMAQAMQQAANGQPNQQANPNGQPGQPGANQQNQMAAAQQAMQDQLAEMDAIAKDAQQQQGAAQQAQDAAQQAAGQCNNPGNGPGQPNAPPGGQVAGGQNPGKWGQGNPDGRKGGGQGEAGQAAGGGIGKEEAPFGVKSEHAPVQNNEDGKFIAATFVKGGAIKNESLAKLQEATASAERVETDDVDQERISGEAKRAVKEYFGQINGQAEQK